MASYSDEARAAKISGTVILSVVVRADGSTEDTRALRGPGHGLEQQAIQAVQKWRFRPALGPDGKPVACIVNVEVTFKVR